MSGERCSTECFDPAGQQRSLARERASRTAYQPNVRRRVGRRWTTSTRGRDQVRSSFPPLTQLGIDLLCLQRTHHSRRTRNDHASPLANGSTDLLPPRRGLIPPSLLPSPLQRAYKGRAPRVALLLPPRPLFRFVQPSLLPQLLRTATPAPPLSLPALRLCPVMRLPRRRRYRHTRAGWVVGSTRFLAPPGSMSCKSAATATSSSRPTGRCARTRVRMSWSRAYRQARHRRASTAAFALGGCPGGRCRPTFGTGSRRVGDSGRAIRRQGRSVLPSRRISFRFGGFGAS